MRQLTKTKRFLPDHVIRKVKGRLYIKNISDADIAAAANVQPPTVRFVLSGFGKSKNVMETVSRLLGDDNVEKTWGKVA